MSIAVGVGLALALGVITTYIAQPEGNVPLLALGVLAVGVVRRYQQRSAVAAQTAPVVAV